LRAENDIEFCQTPIDYQEITKERAFSPLLEHYDFRVLSLLFLYHKGNTLGEKNKSRRLFSLYRTFVYDTLSAVGGTSSYSPAATCSRGRNLKLISSPAVDPMPSSKSPKTPAVNGNVSGGFSQKP
jgi:hypothetical protein